MSVRKLALVASAAACVGLSAAGAAGVATATPSPHSAGSSINLVEVTAQPALFLSNNGFVIKNVTTTSGARVSIPAGTRFVLDSNGVGNVAVGSYQGYNLSLLNINGGPYTVTLTKALIPGESLTVSLGAVQVTALTSYSLTLDSYANQPIDTKTVLNQTEYRNPSQTEYLADNKAGITCFAAVAPVASLCRAS